MLLILVAAALSHAAFSHSSYPPSSYVPICDEDQVPTSTAPCKPA